MTHVIPHGTTEPQDFQLQDDGVALVGTGYDVGLSIHKRVNGQMVAVANPPTVAWLSQAAGTVQVSNVDRLAVDVYFVRYSLTDALGNVGYVPNTEKADVWKVIKVPNP